MDYCNEKGLPEAAVKAAMKECGVEEVGYRRDAWGRIIAMNDVKFNPNETPPPCDALGQLRNK